MTEFTSSIPRKPAPSRRRYVRGILLAIWATFALTVVACCYAVTMVMAAVSKGFDAIFHATFHGLEEALASIFMALVLAVLALFYLLMELASLLSSGQLTPFVMWVIYLLVK